MNSREAYQGLAEIVGKENLLLDDSLLRQYESDGTFLTVQPSAVVRPVNASEVSAVLTLLNERGIPVTPWGAGSGLSGGAVAVQGGVVLSTERMQHLEIDPGSMTVTAGAGVITGELAAGAADMDLFYPPDPASLHMCTIGGNIATNAGGPSCLKYGVTSEYVLGLEVVLADGRILRLGGKSRKRSAGYRLTQLFIGSEGTLGVVTEAILRLLPRPRHSGTLLASFDSIDACAESVSDLLRRGHLPCACELIDASSLAFVSDLLPTGFPIDAAGVLLIEQDGSDQAQVRMELQELENILSLHGARSIVSESLGAGGNDALWHARRSIGLRLIERRSHRLPEDLGVPIDQIPQMVRAVHDVSRRLGVDVALFGHAGDGNLHPSLLFEDRTPETLEKVASAVIEIFQSAIALGGTVSAEHGLGATKREFAELDVGSEALDLMRQIKKVLDPNGILNPGKIFPTGRLLDPSFMHDLPGWL